MFSKNCPTANKLEAVASSPNDAKLQRIAQHVAGCERCRVIVEAIRTNAEFLSDVRSALGPEVSPQARKRIHEICREAFSHEISEGS